MKTSTKLIIILFISIPVLLYAYNWSLREQFIAGKAEEFDYRGSSDRLTERKLPTFKHLVIDGTVRSGTAKMYKQFALGFNPDIHVSKAKGGEQRIKVNKLFENILQTRVRKDTLFVGFHRDRPIKEIPRNFYNRLITIELNDVESISCTQGSYTINSLASDSLRVVASGNSQVAIENSAVDKLHVLVRGRFAIAGKNKIKELHYSLSTNAHISLDHSNNTIGKVVPGRIDTSATISLTEKAVAVPGYGKVN